MNIRNSTTIWLAAADSIFNLLPSMNKGEYTMAQNPIVTIEMENGDIIKAEVVDLQQQKAGDISMESEAFTARKVNVSVGVGELSVNQISASEKAVFEVGTGDVSILNGQFPKVSIEAGVGDAVFSGSVSNKLEVEAGTGDVNVSLTGTEKSYAFDLSAGLGEIRLNGQSKGAFDAEYETGSNGGAEVELTAGVGDISVLTQQ